MMLKPIKLAILFLSLTEDSIEANSEVDVSCGLLDVLASKLLAQFGFIIFIISYNLKLTVG